MQSAEDALAKGRGDQVLRLISAQTERADLRYLRARAVAQVEGPLAALAQLDRQQSVPTALAEARQWLQQWPLPLRGALAADIGDWSHLAGYPAAVMWWTLAIEQGGPGIDIDRLLLAVAEASAAAQRWTVAESSAATLWARRGPWQLRSRGGELLAHALIRKAADDSVESEAGQAAVSHLLTLLAAPELSDDQHRRLALMLAQFTWRERPALALRVADRALRLVPAAGSSGPDTPSDQQADAKTDLALWHALALAQLDAQQGAEALRALGKKHQQLSVVRHELARMSAVEGEQLSTAAQLRQAEAALALGDWPRARQLLQMAHRHDGRALALWLQLPDSEPSALTTLPSASSREGGFALVQALAQRGERASAWRVLRPLVAVAGPDSESELDRLHWALALSKDQAPAQRAALLQRSRSYRQEHPAVGQAWAEQAAAQWSAGALSEATASWKQALRYLPADSPWAPLAARYVLSAALHDQPAWRPGFRGDGAQETELRELLARAQAAGLAGDEEAHHAAAWLVAQALVALGDTAQAKQWLRELRQRIDDEQRRQRIENILQQLP